VVVVVVDECVKNEPTSTVDAVDVDLKLRFDERRLMSILVSFYRIRKIKLQYFK